MHDNFLIKHLASNWVKTFQRDQNKTNKFQLTFTLCLMESRSFHPFNHILSKKIALFPNKKRFFRPFYTRAESKRAVGRFSGFQLTEKLVWSGCCVLIMWRKRPDIHHLSTKCWSWGKGLQGHPQWRRKSKQPKKITKFFRNSQIFP